MLNKVLKQGLKFIHFLEDSALVSLIVGLVLLSLTQIILRNIGVAGFMWADTATRVLVLWLAFFGAMRASRLQNHIAIDLLSHYASLTIQKIIHFFVYISCSIVCSIAAYYCWDFVRDEYEIGMNAFLFVPVWFSEMIIPFGLSVIALRFLLQSIAYRPTSFDTTPSHS